MSASCKNGSVDQTLASVRGRPCFWAQGRNIARRKEATAQHAQSAVFNISSDEKVHLLWGAKTGGIHIQLDKGGSIDEKAILPAGRIHAISMLFRQARAPCRHKLCSEILGNLQFVRGVCHQHPCAGESS